MYMCSRFRRHTSRREVEAEPHRYIRMEKKGLNKRNCNQERGAEARIHPAHKGVRFNRLQLSPLKSSLGGGVLMTVQKNLKPLQRT